MKKTWKIEYEIPPLRAIYWAYMEAETEDKVRDAVKEWEPLWRIRRLTETKAFPMSGDTAIPH